MPDFTELKQKHRAVWAPGEYDQIARGIVKQVRHLPEYRHHRSDIGRGQDDARFAAHRPRYRGRSRGGLEAGRG